MAYLKPVDHNEFDSIKQGQEVNPIEIWERIDTHEDTGYNCLTN
jgi:hypothetical protein